MTAVRPACRRGSTTAALHWAKCQRSNSSSCAVPVLLASVVLFLLKGGLEPLGFAAPLHHCGHAGGAEQAAGRGWCCWTARLDPLFQVCPLQCCCTTMAILGALNRLQYGSCAVLGGHAALTCFVSKSTVDSFLCLQGSKTPARLPVAVETFLQGEGVKYSRPEPGLLQLAL